MDTGELKSSFLGAIKLPTYIKPIQESGNNGKLRIPRKKNSNKIRKIINKELKNLNKNQKDLDPKYNDLVNKNFWDLI